MKAGRVMSLLGIGRTTLRRWREEGKLKATLLDTGHFDWDDESVYEILNGGYQRGVYLYARSCDNNDDVEQQLSALRKFAEDQGYAVAEEIGDISSGLTMDGTGIRKLFRLVKELKVSAILVTRKDRLSRTNFDFLRYAFTLFGTELIVLSNLHDEEVDRMEYSAELDKFNELFQKTDFADGENNEESGELDEGTGLVG